MILSAEDHDGETDSVPPAGPQFPLAGANRPALPPLTHDDHKETVWRVLQNLIELEAALGRDDDSPTGRPGSPCVRVEPGTQ